MRQTKKPQDRVLRLHLAKVDDLSGRGIFGRIKVSAKPEAEAREPMGH
jgi:hypothetical protein